jgi:tetratricopeptide (TPR) repeat protein
MLAKINSVRCVFFALALMLLFSGCTPAGPRALLKGKKYLDHGDVAAAVTQFKRATTLLATNANAWNYYGVALQRAGQADEAAVAYQNALRCDRDLVEAHFNLGLLWLDQNRPDLAKFELTTYTLRRPNDATGWLKLGFAQLHAGEIMPAERSFSTVLSLKTSEAEAYNGLGLARLQAGKTREAAQFFAASVQSRPDFAPALENLATVDLQYLHDSKAALAVYEAYLALSPRPANYNEVKAIVANLTQSDVAATVMAPAVVIKTSAPPMEPKPKVATIPAPRPPPVARTEPEENYTSRSEETHVNHVAPRQTTSTPAISEPVPIRTQTVQIQPEPEIVTQPKTNRPMHPTVMTAPKVTAPKPAEVATTNAAAPQEPLEVAVSDDEQPRAGFWHRLFNGDKPGSAKRYHAETFTPIPATNDQIADTKPEEKPVEAKPQPVTSTARYAFTAPAKPVAGDRRGAEGPFTKARLAEQDENWADAEQWYQSAADTDPAWFEAQYNTGVIAHRLGAFSVALPRYELALAIQPESVDARYNFALALKAAGYPLDAAAELKKILSAHPDEVRAHLALANLCAQSLHDTPQARQHYLRVLELQPNNPQAADIRFWLSANSKPNAE